MNMSEMSSEGNTLWTADTIKSGSYLYLLHDLSLETRLLISKKGLFSNRHILQIGNLNNDLKYKRKWRLLKKVKLASATALSGLNNTLRGNRKLK